jgi:hypothetical protein
MSTRWYYGHAGHVLGPYTGAEVYWLAALGLLRPEDRLWPEGQRPQEAVRAASVIDFSSLRRPRLAPPPWLADLSRSPEPGPQKVQWLARCMPDWLDDVRQLERESRQHAERPATEKEDDAVQPPSEQPGAGVKEKQPCSETVPSLLERAQAAIDVWAKLDCNKAVIMSNDPDALRRDVAIRLILRLVEPGGADMVDRFWKHLQAVIVIQRHTYLASGE